MISQNEYQMLKNAMPFLATLSQEDRNALLQSAIHGHFDKGETIHDGTRCTGVLLVKSGCLRVYLLSEEGREVTLYRLFEGDICILSASCAIHNLTFDVLVDAEEDTDLTVIGGCAFAELADRIPEVKIFALERAVSDFSDVMWVFEQILFMSMDRRLAIFLLDELSKSNTDTIKLTQEQIAKYMGSAREVVSRMLKYFSGEGIVENLRGGIRVKDKKRLRAIAM
ncbi:MAG: Crp/Fnr family transcriptional regulator [Clostridia bacterium]|nr:Crp/Fnr family transcriptional regulator [Clostridia bacterium]